MGHLGKGHCDGHPLMPQHGAEPSLPPPSRCGGASVASNDESHRHPLVSAHKYSHEKWATCLVETPVVVVVGGGGYWLLVTGQWVLVGVYW